VAASQIWALAAVALHEPNEPAACSFKRKTKRRPHAICPGAEERSVPARFVYRAASIIIMLSARARWIQNMSPNATTVLGVLVAAALLYVFLVH
jgi:hypothetical protein